MLKKSLYAVFASLFFSTAYSQDQNFLNQYVELKNEKDSIEKVLLSKNNEIALLNDTIKLQKGEIAELKQKIEQNQSGADLLNSQIHNLQEQIDSFAKEKARFDNVRLRYANGRLQLPYDKNNVDEALKLFREIEDQEIKNEFVDLPKCLTDYPSAIVAVKQALSTLQTITPTYNKITLDKWKAKSRELLQNNIYSSTYANSYRNGVSIYFLDTILKEAKTRVDKASDPKQVTFEDLIIRLDP